MECLFKTNNFPKFQFELLRDLNRFSDRIEQCLFSSASIQWQKTISSLLVDNSADYEFFFFGREWTREFWKERGTPQSSKL